MYNYDGQIIIKLKFAQQVLLHTHNTNFSRIPISDFRSEIREQTDDHELSTTR
jgi:hypothetical protein